MELSHPLIISEDITFIFFFSTCISNLHRDGLTFKRELKTVQLHDRPLTGFVFLVRLKLTTQDTSLQSAILIQ